MEAQISSERERIEQLMLSEGLNSIQFATETGIKSATLSHILNGRNNPSLEVMKKILDRYRTVSSDWLFLGIGQMYRQKSQPQTLSLFENSDENNRKSDNYTEKNTEKSTSEKLSIQQNKPLEQENISLSNILQVEKSKSIAKIIVYYTDNTFQEFFSK
ncbi:Helix-turn-helix domain protein [uncultured Paludibacter sp.]|uniref:Helix-turn-helix domain protein n=1 Tax=uncultured Paludibacter sp. TaxID=497635 RepID=A0A653A5Z8_9BACT|nr:Helix-turn-helix domain protein [uncultured Paludibacter sp.]